MRYIDLEGQTISHREWYEMIVRGEFILMRGRIGEIEVTASSIGVALDGESPPLPFLVTIQSVPEPTATATAKKKPAVVKYEQWFATSDEAIRDYERALATIRKN